MTRTNAFTLLCVVIRVAALYLLIGLVLALPTVFAGAHASQANGMSPWLFVVPVVIGIAIAVGLWLFAGGIARLAVSRPPDQIFESDLDAATWFGIALAVIGAYFFLDAFLDGIRLAGHLLLVAQKRAQYPGIDIQRPASGDVIATITQLLIGAALVLRGRGIAAVLHRLRYAGHMRDSGSAEKQ